MATVAARVDERYRAPLPPQRLAALRILVGTYAAAYLVVRWQYLWSVARFDDGRFDPVGPVAWLEQPIPSSVGHAALLASLAAGAAFVAGWRWRVTGPLFAVLFLAVTTYSNSWGQVFHTENLVALHLVLLAISPAADTWSVDSGAGRRAPSGDTSAYGWPVRLITLVTVLAYVVAGYAKLRNGGMHWVTGDVLRNQVAHDNLRKALLGSNYSPVASVALRNDWIFPPLAALSVLVELGALVALTRSRLRIAWITGAWAFHVGVLVLMAIAFPYQLSGVAYASLLPVERLPAWARSRYKRLASTMRWKKRWVRTSTG